jgi:hypothetical protein
VYTGEILKYGGENMNAALAIRSNEIDGDFMHSFPGAFSGRKIAVEADYRDTLKAKRNAEYTAMLDRSFNELREGNVIVKTMAELEAMAAD